MVLRLVRARAKNAPSPMARQVDPIDALYHRHVGQVKRWARQLAGPAAALGDLVHDIFLIPHRKGFQDRAEGSVETRLFRSARRGAAAAALASARQPSV